MAIKLGDKISALDVNTVVGAKSSITHWNTTFNSTGRGDSTKEHLVWIRDRDIGFPHDAAETTQGLWDSGTTYAVGDTVVGLSRATGLSDGIIWEKVSNAGSAQRPGEPGDNGADANYIVQWLPKRGWNYYWDLDVGGRYLTRIEIIKQVWDIADWIPDYYVCSQDIADDPIYLMSDQSKWPGAHGRLFFWLEPGYYKTYVKDEWSGFGKSTLRGYNKPWQKDMTEDEYIRVYESDLSDFQESQVTISLAAAGRLGSTADPTDTPPGGINPLAKPTPPK